MNAALAAVVRFFVDFVARWLSDARRDAELIASGEARASARASEEAAAAERRASDITPQDADETISALERGEF